MRITILAIGSRGDVQPCIALGVGLRRAGHEVRIATHNQFQALAIDQGLDFYPLAGDSASMRRMQSIRRKAAVDPCHAVRQLAGFLTPLAKNLWSDTWTAVITMLTIAGGWFKIAERLWGDTWEACHGTDAIVHSFFASFLGHCVAERLGVPCFATSICPTFSPTCAFPHLSFPELPLGGGYNWLTHIAFDQFVWKTFQLGYGCARLKKPNLPCCSAWPYDRLNGSQVPILYAYSSAVVPKPPDWDDWRHVTGYWFLDSPVAWQPPDDLVNFIEAGPPPVYVGFGSVSDIGLEELTKITLEALARSGQRGLLQTGWRGLSNAVLPDHVFKIKSVPHDWLFPRMAAVVHHGGAGTTAAGLRAGLPSVLIPFVSDQPYWGRRIAQLGVGPKPIPRRRLSVERLAAGIVAATSDQDMQRRAAALGQRIRAENGVAKAVEVFQRHLSAH